MMDHAFATILKTGPGTSIQDLGRIGQSKYGIPVSGVMDERSFNWINHILKNKENEAVLEIAQPGFQIQFEGSTSVSIAGANAKISLNGLEIDNAALIKISPKDTLEIGAFISGARVYLGIRFGFQTQEILNSRSFYEGLTTQNQLSKGSKIPYFSDSEWSHRSFAKAKWTTDWYLSQELSTYPGPDFYLLSEETKTNLLSGTFKISPLSNRMGIQLEEKLENELPELPTNPVYPGTVQLTSGGKIILLAKDAQVTGGYPRILQLTPDSQSILAQKRPGDALHFKLLLP
ncbi:biotin-dependent carboxyltransferase [Algoriphagus lacus]|uniref:Biotin-dependent carboxyltransferase n=1 Tax=Algoriphagus lacus TaxID=2056311 RepID=A0A418PRU6_9BACT|nr:biotin-dependent carboxyltransferase family protein [Algoriphagus lacus]RIW15555.1 biotin-dependent carboxyltransferase [Algoriphagus lacus]